MKPKWRDPFSRLRVHRAPPRHPKEAHGENRRRRKCVRCGCPYGDEPQEKCFCGGKLVEVSDE